MISLVSAKISCSLADISIPSKSTFLPKSALLIIIIRFVSSVSSSNFWSSWSSSLLPSITNKTRSAFLIISFDFSTPRLSTILSVSLIPAVSIIFNKIPSTVTDPSTTSLVVPAIFVTIAFSSFNIAFNKLDLPTLGLPMIAVWIPSFNNLIFLESSMILFIFSIKEVDIGKSLSAVNSSTSSYSG